MPKRRHFHPPSESEVIKALQLDEKTTPEIPMAFQPSSSFKPVVTPGPNDWLERYDEKGQTFQEFLNKEDREEPNSKRDKIYLVPIGSFDSELAPDLKLILEYVSIFFQLDKDKKVLLLPSIQVTNHPFPSSSHPSPTSTTASPALPTATQHSTSSAASMRAPTGCVKKTLPSLRDVTPLCNTIATRTIHRQARKHQSHARTGSHVTSPEATETPTSPPSAETTPSSPISSASPSSPSNSSSMPASESATAGLVQEVSPSKQRKRKKRRKSTRSTSTQCVAQQCMYIKINGSMEPIKCRRALDHSGIQLCISDLLHYLELTLPSDAFCMIGVTLWDLYMDSDDVFIVGWAGSPACYTGVFSFSRYDPSFLNMKQTSVSVKQQTPAERRMLLLARSLKTVTHEILHLFGLLHCIHFSCLMNGTASLAEDDQAPMFLCPVCLRKLHQVLNFSIMKRYKELVQFYEKVHFKDEAEWVNIRTEMLKKSASICAKQHTEHITPAETDSIICTSNGCRLHDDGMAELPREHENTRLELKFAAFGKTLFDHHHHHPSDHKKRRILDSASPSRTLHAEASSSDDSDDQQEEEMEEVDEDDVEEEEADESSS